jgi:hypothetical protein
LQGERGLAGQRRGKGDGGHCARIEVQQPLFPQFDLRVTQRLDQAGMDDGEDRGAALELREKFAGGRRRSPR